MYAARMLGERMGTLCISARSVLDHERAVSAYGFSEFSVGCESIQLGVLELESRPKEEVHAFISAAIGRLIRDKGADCILLGCAGMAEMRSTCEAVVEGTGVRVLDGVGLGIQFLIGLVRERLGTAKCGIYMDASVDREKRGQSWL